MNPLRAVVLDTDGVLLDSAVLHAAAWKAAFDGCLDAWAADARTDRQLPFDAEGEYRELVDGKPRLAGALAFLTARGIALPPGTPADPPGCDTVWAVAARKEQAFTAALQAGDVQAFPQAFPEVRRVLETLRARGTRCAAASASRHARPLLEATGLAGLVDVLVDGTDAERLALAGKPDPALFLEAARRLRVAPADAALVEDALAGVEAGRRGRFGLVVGLDRTRDTAATAALRAHGADVVLADLTALVGAVTGARP
ncbi:HAD-IA family hydrolase [Streptomyces sp. APSN-46.1]|uniref:HAD family hydrolase n=1 Tax=Streptomyces sp. APSN-46.1 TaxID=2929049 RepID=UPI001FB2894C|nr:HAD-IA family hydrolase [Streptomyces sp. APSN-46.1]MCJ1676968.1 HAD-IA family hydrolase [Streptomyces sp. APSN-46.1]